MPRLFFGESKTTPPIVRTIITFPLKRDGLVLQNPVKSAAEKYTSSLRASYSLIGEVTREIKFSTADPIWAVKEERWDGKKYWDDLNDTKLRGVVNDQGDFEKVLFLHANHTGY